MDLCFREQIMNFLSETQSEPIYHEEVCELAVPESMPEVSRIVNCFGQVCIHDKQVSGATVTVSGTANVSVLYLSDETETVQKIEKQISFSLKKEFSELEQTEYVSVHSWQRRTDAKMLGSRRILIRAEIGSKFTAYRTQEMKLSIPQDEPKTVQLLKNTYEMILPAFCAEKEFRISEEATLPDNAVGIDTIMYSDVKLRIGETKAVGDKAVFKADILLHLLYRTATGTLHCFDTELPFSQYVELNGETENGDVKILAELLTCEVETDAQDDSKRLLVNLNVLAQAVVYNKQSVDLVEDAYCTRGIITPKWQDIMLKAKLDSQTVMVSGEMNVAASTQKVIDVIACPDSPILRRDDRNIKCIIPINTSVTYMDNDGTIRSHESKGELLYESVLDENVLCCLHAAIYEQPIALASYDTVTVRISAQLKIESFMGDRLHTIQSARVEQRERSTFDGPSLIARKIGKESVWDIAKRCGSTVDAICEANGLTAGVAQEGTVLLIPVQ